MSITVECPFCKNKLKAPDRLAGKAAKCPGCQAKIIVPILESIDEIPSPVLQEIGNVGANEQPTPDPQPIATENATSIDVSSPVPVSLTAKEFRCNGCGNVLEIPKNSKGHVKCRFCGNECVLEGLVKNAEIAAKEDINSGIPLDASPFVLHNQLVSSLCDSNYIPLDVFDKIEVIREEKYCIPAYCFYCNANAPFTYEAGNVREHKTAIDLGDKTRVEKERYVEWTQMSSTAAVSATVFASGNKSFSRQIQELYQQHDSNLLIDIEEIDFPPDVKTYEYNMPHPAAFNEYVKPFVDALLQGKAEDSLASRTAKDLSIGGSMINKDITRIYLGLYHIVYTYEGQEYSMWATGDAKRVWNENLPTDLQREKIYLEKLEKASRTKDEFSFGCGCIIFVILFLAFGIFMLSMPVKSNAAGGIFFILLALAGIGYKLYKKSTSIDPYNEQLARDKIDFEEFKYQREKIIGEFRAKKTPLRGIYYEKINGMR